MGGRHAQVTAVASAAFALLLAFSGCMFRLDPGQRVIVENRSGVEVNAVYLAPCEVDFQGPNLLPDDETIADGESRGFSVEGTGCYRIIVEFIDGDWVEDELEIEKNAELTFRIEP